MTSNRPSQEIQSRGFTATGRGYFNKLPSLQADARTGNAILENTALPANHKLRKIYLFCTGVSTGWNVDGSYGQAIDARIFYPRGVTQDELSIRCVVANQYEYDRVVDFIQQHHASTVGNATVNISRNAPAASGGTPLDFKLFRYRIPVSTDASGQIQYRTIHDSMHYEGFVPSIEAGHERFVNAIQFNIPLKISNDFIGNNFTQTALLNSALQNRYLQHFGQAYRPPTPKEEVDLQAESMSEFITSDVEFFRYKRNIE